MPDTSTIETAAPATSAEAGERPVPAAVRLGETNAFEVATVHLTKDNRHLELVGVMHFADNDFWERLDRMLDLRVAEGYTLQSEMITDGPKVYRPMMRQVGRLLTREGLGMQTQALHYSDGRFDIHDFTYQQVVAHVGRVKASTLTLASLMAHVAVGLVGHEGRSTLFGEAFVNRASGFTEGRMGDMHAARERIAIDAAVAAGGDVTALWGAAHVPRMTDTLIAEGWEYEGIEWRQALQRTVAEDSVRVEEFAA
jgi:hypothetical protein